MPVPNFHKFYRARRRGGFTLIEVIISVALLIMLSVLVVGAMIMHMRLAKANMAQQRMTETSRRLLDEIQTFALDANQISVDAGPAGAGTVLTLRKVTPAGGTEIRQYAFINPDANSATIGDNIIVSRRVDTPNATTGDTKIQYVSPVSGTPVFQLSTQSARTLVNINFRIGDRTNPSNNDDNRFTGPGYQSFLVSSNVSQLYSGV